MSDLCGEFEEHEGREDCADAGAHGAAHQSKHQLNVWHQNPNGEANQDHSASDHVEPEENDWQCFFFSKEPGGWDVVINQLRRTNALIGLPESNALECSDIWQRQNCQLPTDDIWQLTTNNDYDNE